MHVKSSIKDLMTLNMYHNNNKHYLIQLQLTPSVHNQQSITVNFIKKEEIERTLICN